MTPHEHQPMRAKAPDEDLGFALPTPAKPGAARLTLFAGATLALLIGAFFFGYLPRRQQSATLAETTRSTVDAAPSVDIVHPKRIPSELPLTLPASLQPLAETLIYPRANGYVQEFKVDFGDHVKQGQLLAIIETPELDQQLDQARAQLLQAEATKGQTEAQREYAKTSLERYKKLRPAGVATQEELDQKSAEAKVAEANVNAATANIEVIRAELRRLTQLKSFARVTAPFAGIITQRNIEVGSLLTAGNSTPLYRLEDVDTMRVFVQVPQDTAVYVQPGASAEISVREFPGRKFTGTLTRAAGALDDSTRTMLTEIRVPNPKHELLAGMYAEAKLSISQPHFVFELPATVLLNDAQGLRVAIVDQHDAIRFRTVTIERDAGATLQIASGLTGDERVVKLANAALKDGTKVRVRD